MTEFEMANLLTGIWSAFANITAIQLTLISGFLVAGYTAAHRLNQWMLWIALSIYTFAYFGNAFLLSRIQISLTGLLEEMRTFAAAGKGLGWHAVANGMAPSWLLEFGPYASWSVWVLIYSGTIIFFFQCRHHNRKAETGTWKPRAP